MADEIVIRISGDIKDYEKALETASKKTSDLSNNLENTAKVAGLAFAAMTGEVILAVHAFGESEKAVNLLNKSLQTQGIYSKDLSEDYQKQATALQRLTGISDEAIISAQTTVQSYLGQTHVTKELTAAIADLATGKQIDLVTSANLVGKAIDGNVGALKRYGLEIDESGTRQERLAQIIEQVNGKFGGQAQAAAQGVGSLTILKELFGDLQEQIGERFAPAVVAGGKALAGMLKYILDNKPVTDFIVSMITAGTVVAGVATAATLGGIAFLKIKAAMEAAKIATTAMSLATKGLVAATGLGLIVVLGTEIYLNWSSIWPRMQAIFAAFTNNIATLGHGLATILKGVFTFDKEAIQKGLDEAKSAFSKGMDDYKKISEEKLGEIVKTEDAAEKKKLEQNDKHASERIAKKEQQNKRELELLNAQKEAELLKEEGASKELQDLKQKEVETLKLIADEKYKGDKEALTVRSEELRAMESEQVEIDKAARQEYQDEILANNEEYQSLTDEQKALFQEQNNARAISEIETERSIRMKAAQDKLNDQIKNNNQFLLEQQKFGTAYAAINSVMNSEIYKGNKQAFGALAELQQSSNSTLKSIGKTAALANIVIHTAESAMNIFAGFSTIPIVGPALGVAGAAAAVAFGAEQFQKVNAAADGGVARGGVPGVDSIPFLLQDQEIVSPAQSFDEVVGSVRAQREAQRMQEEGLAPGGGSAAVMIGFDGKEASQVLTVRQIEDNALGIKQGVQG